MTFAKIISRLAYTVTIIMQTGVVKCPHPADRKQWGGIFGQNKIYLSSNEEQTANLSQLKMTSINRRIMILMFPRCC